MSAGYAITTYKMQLCYKHLDWFKQTQSLFDAVLAFYYGQIDQAPQTLSLTNQNLLRHLELKTIPQRDGTQPENPIPYEKVPLYFRRSAINVAISLYRSYDSRLKAWKEKQKDQVGKGKPNPPGRLHASMLYYKGMYKNFDDRSIMLKLYTGKAWVWVKHRITGRSFPENTEIMSPTVVIRGKKVMLHVPVKEKIEDTRTAKERVKQSESFVAVALSNADTLAVCTTIKADGSASHPTFIKGGKALAHRRKQLIGYIKRGKSNQNTKGILLQSSPLREDGDKAGRTNTKYYQKITCVTDHYAHEVSRKIVDYAKSHNAKIIVMPDYGNTFAKGTQHYLKTSVYDFIGRRIINDVKYKAWQCGIVVQQSNMRDSAKHCAKCGENIAKYNTEYQNPSQKFYGGQNFVCKNGHQGNTILNTARNLGESFYQTFYEKAS
ncbi:hypothetical protein [Eubacterium sp. 1001713B170207_170306_E7]|uniref:hypothetical protein n=1 Tax=Eubacterium sp. 1001713B170207_170306_E7 TaxID=2787097 RepID=UPI00189845FA|nr:hypothetical protein [Eubacterium sp. 1001713B170207_170306_E7]